MRQNACGNYSLDMRRSLRSSTYRSQRPAPRPSWRSRLPPPSSPSRRTARTPKWLQQTIRHHQHLTGGGSGYSPEPVRQTATAPIQRIGVAEQIAACGPITLSPAVATVSQPPSEGHPPRPTWRNGRQCRAPLLDAFCCGAQGSKPPRLPRELAASSPGRTIVTIVPCAREAAQTRRSGGAASLSISPMMTRSRSRRSASAFPRLGWLSIQSPINRARVRTLGRTPSWIGKPSTSR